MQPGVQTVLNAERTVNICGRIAGWNLWALTRNLKSRIMERNERLILCMSGAALCMKGIDYVFYG